MIGKLAYAAVRRLGDSEKFYIDTNTVRVTGRDSEEVAYENATQRYANPVERIARVVVMEVEEE